MWSCCSLSVPGRFGPVDGNGYHRRMSMHRILAAFAFALASACALAFIPSPASAIDCQPQVQGGRVRLGPAGMPMMAGLVPIEHLRDRQSLGEGESVYVSGDRGGRRAIQTKNKQQQ